MPPQPPPPYGPPLYGPPLYGPPLYGSNPYGTNPYGLSPYGPSPYGAPGWGWAPPPQRPQPPGPVVAAAVMAFVSALLVLLGTFYAVSLGAVVSLARGPGDGVSPWLALLHVVLTGLLVTGGIRVLHRDQRWLLAAVVVQLALSCYWFLTLGDLAPAVFADTARLMPVPYLLVAAVAGGLLLLPDSRAWTSRPPTSRLPASHPEGPQAPAPQPPGG